MEAVIDLAVDALAVYRIQRVVTTDEIGDPIRQAVKDHELVYELATCPWCLSVWVAGLLWLVPRRVRRALALSALSGVLAHVVG